MASRPAVQFGTSVTVAALGIWAMPHVVPMAPGWVPKVAAALVLLAALVGFSALATRSTTSVLTIILVLLFIVPQNYVLVGPLRSAGNPALLGGMFALVLWAAGRLLGMLIPERNHPARWVVALYVFGALTASAAALMRPLTESESSGATRALFPLAAMAGIALLACDGLATKAQVEIVLQRLVWVVGVAAVIGVLEFTSVRFNYRSIAHLPGLTTNTELINDTRSGFQRVMASASHPIEYSVVVASLVPLALHQWRYAASLWARRANLTALVAMVAVTPMTVSRSGVVCLVVGLAWYAVDLNGRGRLNLAVAGIIGLGLMRTAIPGLLGTLRSLLFIGEQDPSIRGRTIDYAKIPSLMEGHWLFGRGWGTFQPEQYFFLDNQYLGSLLEGGLLGLTILIALFVVTMGLARGARKRSMAQRTRSLGQALSACGLAFAVGGLTFDELSFRQTGLTMFLLLGCAGALWSAVRHEGRPDVPCEQPVSLESTPAGRLSGV